MTADNEIDIKEAFQRAQKGHNNKAKLVASLKSRYSKVSSFVEMCDTFYIIPFLYCVYIMLWHTTLTYRLNPCLQCVLVKK